MSANLNTHCIAILLLLGFTTVLIYCNMNFPIKLWYSCFKICKRVRRKNFQIWKQEFRHIQCFWNFIFMAKNYFYCHNKMYFSFVNLYRVKISHLILLEVLCKSTDIIKMFPVLVIHDFAPKPKIRETLKFHSSHLEYEP